MRHLKLQNCLFNLFYIFLRFMKFVNTRYLHVFLNHFQFTLFLKLKHFLLFLRILNRLVPYTYILFHANVLMLHWTAYGTLFSKMLECISKSFFLQFLLNWIILFKFAYLFPKIKRKVHADSNYLIF